MRVSQSWFEWWWCRWLRTASDDRVLTNWCHSNTMEPPTQTNQTHFSTSILNQLCSTFHFHIFVQHTRHNNTRLVEPCIGQLQCYYNTLEMLSELHTAQCAVHILMNAPPAWETLTRYLILLQFSSSVSLSLVMTTMMNAVMGII